MRLLSVLWLLAGCESHTGCTPGATAACACIDGAMGAQSCRPDGTFDVCVCTDPIQNSSPVDMSQPSRQSPPDQAVSSGGARRIFVTSTAYVGSAVTTACSNAAAAANLGGTWTPWLSTQSL